MTHVLIFCIIRGSCYVHGRGCGNPFIFHTDS